MENLNFHDKTYVLVDLFIGKNKWEKWTNMDWSRERAASKRLLTRYPEFSFFYNLMDLQEKFNSLLGLLNKRNEIELGQRYKKFIEEKLASAKNKVYNIEEDNW